MYLCSSSSAANAESGLGGCVPHSVPSPLVPPPPREGAGVRGRFRVVRFHRHPSQFPRNLGHNSSGGALAALPVVTRESTFHIPECSVCARSWSAYSLHCWWTQRRERGLTLRLKLFLLNRDMAIVTHTQLTQAFQRDSLSETHTTNPVLPQRDSWLTTRYIDYQSYCTPI